MNIEEQKELEHLNNELLMRIKKEYSDGAMLFSFSLIYFATITELLIKIINSSDFPSLPNILIFIVVSVASFMFPVFVYYPSATHSRENVSAIINIASYKKTYFENYKISKDGILSGSRWENFHRTTMSSYLEKNNNEVFFLAGLSLVLYIGSLFLGAYYSFAYIQKNKPELSLAMVAAVVLFYIVFLVPIVSRVIKLQNLYNPKDVFLEIKSMNMYYDIQSKLVKTAKNDEELNIVLQKLKDADCKF